MHITRVQIEEGFLDGLDVSFTSGLNVIIGERGTGKTSLIELMRFCLGVPGYTPESTKRSGDHALSVLGSGQVTVTLSDGEHKVLVTRTAADESPRASGPAIRPIVFSQTEIEAVGLQAQGRLRLLDSFIKDRRDRNSQETAVISEVRSLTAEADALCREIDELFRQVEEIPVLDKQIADHSPKEQALAKVSSDAADKKCKLDAISKRIAASAVGVAAIERFLLSISKWQSLFSALISQASSLETWPNGAGPDPLTQCRVSIERAKGHLDKAEQELQQTISQTREHLKSAHDSKLSIETQARQLRQEIESLQAGAGAIIRQGQQLRERKAQLESLKKVLRERQKSFKALMAERENALDRLEEIREERFNVRKKIASKLSETLGPHIRVKAYRAGQFETYSASIADILRGSGLRYNELSPILAKNLSPRELLDAADSNDFDLIAVATGITKERGARVLAKLRESDLGALATVAIEDNVALQLLDGTDYKNIGDLSTGQRCTVVLPLVLRHTEHVLVVDQPEDHIDNAFIANTLIVSVLARKPNSQIIFSTHNANIPVLGNADRVIHLGSDGKRGFPVLVSNLDDSHIVKAITTVMEGGEQAFRRRASFYRKHAK